MTDIEVIHLSRGEEPPKGELYILVEKTTSGTILTVLPSGNVAVLRQGPYAKFKDAMASAREWAPKHGIETIYVKGASHA